MEINNRNLNEYNRKQITSSNSVPKSMYYQTLKNIQDFL
jgi:hypothetical protein